jgi:ubiquinone/menaquinone biosynthesis C-methylase UbiE
MATSAGQLGRIQRQFRRQARAYEALTAGDERGFEALVALSGVTADQRVVDVACGPGFLTMTFAARCRHAIGVDATDTFLEHASEEAHRRSLANVAFTLGHAEALPFPDGAFQLAACRAAFHHFARVERVLSEMMRVVGPHGRLLIADMTTSEDPAQARYHHRLERLCDPTHVRALPVSEFERLFARHGLTVAFTGRSQVDSRLPEWIAHGGPPPARVAKIVELMRASLDTDRSGLAVRLEAGEIHFSHTGVAFLLEKPGA